MSAHIDRRQRLYLYLAGVFVTALLIGDTIGSKVFTITLDLGFTTLHPTLSVGAMWFPITFLLTDVINEFYGADGARTVTIMGLVMAVLAFAMIFAARMIPAASFSPIPQAMFDQVFGGANRIFAASLVAYVIGQLLDIAVFRAIKKRTEGKMIWLRATGSTLFSQLIDTIVVTYLAFSGRMPEQQLRQAMVTSYVVKVGVAILLTPVVYALHGLIHRKLGIEAIPPSEA